MKLLVKITQECQGRYRACCPSLPGCVARGQSQQEAKDNMDRAILGYLASLNVAAPNKLEQHVMMD